MPEDQALNPHTSPSQTSINQTLSHQPSLVLASGSAYRREQLASQLMYPITAITPNIDESPMADETPEALSKRLSVAKAQAVQARAPANTVIIAGDQTAECNGKLLHKPGSADAARRQLETLSGQTVLFYSGLSILDTRTGQYLCDTVTTRVTFRALTPELIDVYVRRDRPWDCVGAFKNESLGIALLKEVSSQDPSALTGLPLIRLVDFLLDFGVNIIEP